MIVSGFLKNFFLAWTNEEWHSRYLVKICLKICKYSDLFSNTHWESLYFCPHFMWTKWSTYLYQILMEILTSTLKTPFTRLQKSTNSYTILWNMQKKWAKLGFFPPWHPFQSVCKKASQTASVKWSLLQ